MAHTFSSLLVHVIFSTKERQPHLDASVRGRLFPYVGGILRETGATALAINSVADHVHSRGAGGGVRLGPHTRVEDEFFEVGA